MEFSLLVPFVSVPLATNSSNCCSDFNCLIVIEKHAMLTNCREAGMPHLIILKQNFLTGIWILQLLLCVHLQSGISQLLLFCYYLFRFAVWNWKNNYFASFFKVVFLEDYWLDCSHPTCSFKITDYRKPVEEL